MSAILHLDLEGFFVAVERLHNPALRERPLIIGGQPQAWGCVVAASHEAAARGVRAGLSLAVAAVKCPDAVFLDGSIERYLDASAAVDEILREPMVPVEWTAIDSVFLDLTGHASRLGPSRALAERLQARIRRELGFDVACGLAGTMTAARIASRLSRPNGLLYVLPGYEARLLAPLDVDMLPDLPPGARGRLLEQGITSVGEVARMNDEQSLAVLGRRGPVFTQRAQGLDPRSVDGTQPPRSMARDVTLAEPLVDEARLITVLRHVSEVLGLRLRDMGWFAHTVTLRLALADDESDGPAGRATAARSPDFAPSPNVAPSRDFARSPDLAVSAGSPVAGTRGTPFGDATLVVTRSITLREATAASDELFGAARALFRVAWRRRAVLRAGIVLSGLQRVGPQIPLFPVSERPGTDTGFFRTRQGLRALVEGRYLEVQRSRRRAG